MLEDAAADEAAVPLVDEFVSPEACPFPLARYFHPAANIVRVSFHIPWLISPELMRTRFVVAAFPMVLPQKDGVVAPS
jgi:hypothetical protein